MPSPATQQLMQTALVHHQAGRFADAQNLYRQVLALDPRNADALHLLGLIHFESAHLDGAISLISQAIKIRPKAAEFHVNLGAVMRQSRRFAEALNMYQKAIALDPQLPEAHNGLASLLLDMERPEDAIAASTKALSLRPNFTDAMNNLGIAWMALGRYSEAAQYFSRAVAIRPNYPEVLSNLGNALEKEHKLTDAIAACHRAVQLNPNLPQAWTNLGNSLRQQGRITEAIAAYRQSLQIAPKNPIARRHLLTALNFSNEPAQSIAAEHRQWAETLPPSPQYPRERAREMGRPLRIAYLSADFKDQVVAAFLHRVLEHHNHSDFHITAYSDVRHPDSITATFQTYCDDWRDIATKTNEQVTNQIRSDRIDILVDLMGHIEGNRLPVFVAKCAPIQLTWLGYPNTTGLRSIDYRLTDSIADPPGQTETLHTEKLHRLPHSFLCYGPLHEVPIAPPPIQRNNHITFGCFNDLQKVNANVIAIWSQLLTRIPTARLMLKARSLIDPGTADYVRQQFASHGISQSRLDLVGWHPTIDSHLQSYSRIDIALDPFPYNGTTTTCEALWHGVPVIALAGQSHVARVSASILTNIGLPNLLATDPAGYIAIATALAGDVPRLSELRQSMRQRMLASPLMDAPSFTRALENAYREMWMASSRSAPVQP